MKQFVISMVVCVTAVTAAGAGDVLRQLRFSKSEAEQEAVFAISVGQVPLEKLAKAFKPAPPEVKVALVEQAMSWTKAYTSTPQFEQAYQEFRESYKPSEDDAESMAQWKQDFPAKGRDAVKKRLREFLRESADVDYDAKLVREGGKMVFANDAYESEKSGEWKICYRAGKEPVAKARAIAQAWLKELGG